MRESNSGSEGSLGECIVGVVGGHSRGKEARLHSFYCSFFFLKERIYVTVFVKIN